MGHPDDDKEVEEIESNLIARYETEEYVYYPAQQPPLHLFVKSATSTIGSNLTGDNRDRTGIMIWPATHLLCQWLSEKPFSQDRLSGAVLELGCGCGLVGVTAKLVYPHLNWLSTDMDDKALEITVENYRLNGISPNATLVQNLRWGDKGQIHSLQNKIIQLSAKGVSTIVAADIVYPSTANQVLRLLWETVDSILAPRGIFYLSFCTRDGHRTPLRLIHSACEAGFEISAVDYALGPEVKRKLPPMLDAKLLILQRGNVQRNEALGGPYCPVFPGLTAAVQRTAEQSSDEEWEPPAFVDGDDEPEFLEHDLVKEAEIPY